MCGSRLCRDSSSAGGGSASAATSSNASCRRSPSSATARLATISCICEIGEHNFLIKSGTANIVRTIRLFLLVMMVVMISCCQRSTQPQEQPTRLMADTFTSTLPDTQTVLSTDTLTPTQEPSLTIANLHTSTPSLLSGPLPDGARARLNGKGYLEDIAISPDSRTMVIAWEQGIYQYRLDTLDLVWNKTVHAHEISFSPDGNSLAIAAEYGISFFGMWPPENKERKQVISILMG